MIVPLLVMSFSLVESSGTVLSCMFGTKTAERKVFLHYVESGRRFATSQVRNSAHDSKFLRRFLAYRLAIDLLR